MTQDAQINPEWEKATHCIQYACDDDFWAPPFPNALSTQELTKLSHDIFVSQTNPSRLKTSKK